MPQWAGSCWYYLRYLAPQDDTQPWPKEAERRWAPVDLYIGGAEHAVLHLLYARFWHKVLLDLGHVSTAEPFRKLRHQGTVLAHTFRDARGHYRGPDEVEHRADGVCLKATGEPVAASIEKMSKSALNGVNPDDVVEQHGADALRLYLMFMGEFEQAKPWDPRAIEGMSRFLRRVFRLVEGFAAAGATDDPHRSLRHRTITKVTEDLEALKFNTAIAALMEYVNALTRQAPTRDDLIALIRLLGPFAPHIADEAWETLGEKEFVIEAAWPDAPPDPAGDAEVTLAVQVDGKLRATLTLPRNAPETQVRAEALALSAVGRHTQGKPIKAVHIVPGKVVSIVTG